MADKNNSQPDVNEQIKVRMDKLAALQEAGKDPFQITKYDVTHHTDEIRAIYEAHEKELLGDRPAVNTDGMDEQQAREAVNADYNERRAISSRTVLTFAYLIAESESTTCENPAIPVANVLLTSVSIRAISAAS